jgi:hypothetical protein
MRIILSLSIIIIFGGSYTSLIGQTVYENLFWTTGSGAHDPSAALFQFDRFDTVRTQQLQTTQNYLPLYSSGYSFVQGGYLNEASDELFLASSYDQDLSLPSNEGSILIFSATSSLQNNSRPIRRIHGPNTGLDAPKSCWMDPTRDLLYVANTEAQNILVFESASILNGNLSPSRVIPVLNGKPEHVFVDPVTNRLFVTVSDALHANHRIDIYNYASIINESSIPHVSICGNVSELNLNGSAPVSSWFHPTKQLLAVVKKEGWLLFYDLSQIIWNASATTTLQIIPRKVEIEDFTANDLDDISFQGMYWDQTTDKFYCNSTVSLYENGNFLGYKSRILLLNQLSLPSESGYITASKTYTWSNSLTYPIGRFVWLYKTTPSSQVVLPSQSFNVLMFPQPARENLHIDLGIAPPEPLKYIIHSMLEQRISEGQIDKQEIDVNISLFPPGVYLLQLEFGKNSSLHKFIIGR